MPQHAYLIHSFLEGILISAIVQESRHCWKQWILGHRIQGFLVARHVWISSRRYATAVGLHSSQPNASPELKPCMQLQPECSIDLQNAFKGADGDIGKFASQFFTKCEEIENVATTTSRGLQYFALEVCHSHI